jgi:hypothetical protein
VGHYTPGGSLASGVIAMEMCPGPRLSSATADGQAGTSESSYAKLAGTCLGRSLLCLGPFSHLLLMVIVCPPRVGSQAFLPPETPGPKVGVRG